MTATQQLSTIEHLEVGGFNPEIVQPVTDEEQFGSQPADDEQQLRKLTADQLARHDAITGISASIRAARQRRDRLIIEVASRRTME
jgi:hypothetical protein